MATGGEAGAEARGPGRRREWQVSEGRQQVLDTCSKAWGEGTLGCFAKVSFWKEHGGHVWGDRNVLYLHCGGGYEGVYILPKCVLRSVHLIILHKYT